MLQVVDNRIGYRCGIAQCLGDEDDDQPIDSGIGGTDFHGLAPSFGGGVADNIDGVATAPEGGQNPIQLGHGFRRKPGRLQAQLFNGIHRHDTRTAAIGNDGQAGPGRQRLLGNQLGTIEECFDGVHLGDAGPGKCGAIDVIRARQGTGVRIGCGRAGL